MNIQQKVHDALSAIGAIAGAVFPNVLPQTPPYPCAAYQFIANPPADSFMASAFLTDFHVQVTLHTVDYPGLLALRQSVINAVYAMPEHIVRETDIESPYEFDVKTFTWILGFHLRDTEQ